MWRSTAVHQRRSMAVHGSMDRHGPTLMYRHGPPWTDVDGPPWTAMDRSYVSQVGEMPTDLLTHMKQESISALLEFALSVPVLYRFNQRSV